MKIRSFIFFGVLVLFGTLLLLGFDTETSVRETIMVYSVFVIFPFAWFYYEYSNSPYYFSDIIETKNLRQLYVPTTVIFILLFILSIGIRSEEHTSELQSRGHLVCRLLLEKKK